MEIDGFYLFVAGEIGIGILFIWDDKRLRVSFFHPFWLTYKFKYFTFMDDSYEVLQNQ